MKLDYGLFTAIRQHLLTNATLRDLKIFTLFPPQRQYPLIVLDLEEVWSSFTDKPLLSKQRILFSVVILVSAIQQPAQQIYAALIMKLLNGASFRLEESRQGTLRFLKSLREDCDKQGIRTLRQIFEVYIH